MPGLSMDDGITQAVQGIERHCQNCEHWRIAFSGGKDSTALATLLCHLADAGRIQCPSRVTLTIVDTLQELPPLIDNAHAVADLCRDKCGWDTVFLQPALEDSFLFQLLGRGLFTPGMNGRNRWCTRKLKLEPMTTWESQQELKSGVLLYGSRVDESDSRAVRMAEACTLAGSECGQGLYMVNQGRKYAPLTNWRNCSVWDWLIVSKIRVGYDCGKLLRVYGDADACGAGTELTPEQIAEAIDATTRTGCIGCPVVSHDFALDRICEWPEWRHLSPFKRLRPLYVELREHRHRLRKNAGERLKDGSYVKNQNRVGPICLESRRWALCVIREIQSQVDELADRASRPTVTVLSPELDAMIQTAIAAKLFPRGWTGEEPLATEADCIMADYAGPDRLQPHLF